MRNPTLVSVQAIRSTMCAYPKAMRTRHHQFSNAVVRRFFARKRPATTGRSTERGGLTYSGDQSGCTMARSTCNLLAAPDTLNLLRSLPKLFQSYGANLEGVPRLGKT